LLRVQASLSFSMIVIAPLLTEFNERYPELRIEMVASKRYQDLLESGIDVAVRNRKYENDSAITVRRLAETKRVLAASPQYLQRHGTLRTPDELKRHRLLIYNLANHPNEMRFTARDGAETSLQVHGVLETNDGQVVCAAALKHLGILLQRMYIIHDDVIAGRLVPLLTVWELQLLTINIAYPTRRHLPAKLRCLWTFSSRNSRRWIFRGSGRGRFNACHKRMAVLQRRTTASTAKATGESARRKVCDVRAVNASGSRCRSSHATRSLATASSRLSRNLLLKATRGVTIAFVSSRQRERRQPALAADGPEFVGWPQLVNGIQRSQVHFDFVGAA
jgi:LysR substrate binding domain